MLTRARRERKENKSGKSVKLLPGLESGKDAKGWSKDDGQENESDSDSDNKPQQHRPKKRARTEKKKTIAGPLQDYLEPATRYDPDFMAGKVWKNVKVGNGKSSIEKTRRRMVFVPRAFDFDKVTKRIPLGPAHNPSTPLTKWERMSDDILRMIFHMAPIDGNVKHLSSLMRVCRRWRATLHDVRSWFYTDMCRTVHRYNGDTKCHIAILRLLRGWRPAERRFALCVPYGHHLQQIAYNRGVDYDMSILSKTLAGNTPVKATFRCSTGNLHDFRYTWGALLRIKAVYDSPSFSIKHAEMYVDVPGYECLRHILCDFPSSQMIGYDIQLREARQILRGLETFTVCIHFHVRYDVGHTRFDTNSDTDNRANVLNAVLAMKYADATCVAPNSGFIIDNSYDGCMVANTGRNSSIPLLASDNETMFIWTYVKQVIALSAERSFVLTGDDTKARHFSYYNENGGLSYIRHLSHTMHFKRKQPKEEDEN